MREEKKEVLAVEDAGARARGLLGSGYNRVSFHRGYYIRARAVDHCVQDFLLKTHSHPRTQVRFLHLACWRFPPRV